MRLVSAATAGVLLTTSLLAQQSLRSFAVTAPGKAGMTRVTVPPSVQPVIVGAPFSAEEVRERTFAAGGGAPAREVSEPQKIFRDTDGRTRMERPGLIELNSPLEGVFYLLDTATKVAYRVKYPAAARPRFDAPPNRSMVRENISGELLTPDAPPPASNSIARTELLGSREIEGLEAYGERTVLTLPPGSIGNSEPVTRTTETWISRALSLPLVSRTSDSSGESAWKLTKIATIEPAAALFRVPAEYTIVDKGSYFTVDHRP